MRALFRTTELNGFVFSSKSCSDCLKDVRFRRKRVARNQKHNDTSRYWAMKSESYRRSFRVILMRGTKASRTPANFREICGSRRLIAKPRPVFSRASGSALIRVLYRGAGEMNRTCVQIDWEFQKGHRRAWQRLNQLTTPDAAFLDKDFSGSKPGVERPSTAQPSGRATPS